MPSAHSQGVAAAAGIRRRIAGSLMQGGVHAWNVILLDYSWITGVFHRILYYKAHPGSLRMASFSKEHDRNVFSCPFYCVKWGPQNLVITAPARIGFTAFNRVCSIGHPVIYDTARVITKGSNPTKSDQSGPTPFLCGLNS